MVLSSDGATLALWGGENPRDLELWDLGSGKKLHTFREHTGPVLGVAMTSDGKYVAGAIGRELGWGAAYPRNKAFVVGIALAASGAGGILFGGLSDRLGRRKVMAWTILVYSVASGACFFLPPALASATSPSSPPLRRMSAITFLAMSLRAAALTAGCAICTTTSSIQLPLCATRTVTVYEGAIANVLAYRYLTEEDADARQKREDEHEARRSGG